MDTPTPNKTAALWGIGFRPFFLLAALAGTGLLSFWLYAFVASPLPQITPNWHAHEMLYGFGAAVLAGFILTSTQNWSGIRGVHGTPLKGLAVLWLVGRMAMLSPQPWLAAVDILFFPALLVALWPYLTAENQKRNRVFILFFSLQITGNLLYHLESFVPEWAMARWGLYLALHIYLLMIMVIGGRIIPAFTRNSVENARLQSWPWVEKAGFALVAVWLVADGFATHHPLTQWIALAAAVAQLIRWWGWHPWQTRHNPILWMLPVGYGWLILGLVLYGIPAPFSPPVSVATHAFTAGAMGVMMYAMMTRVGLGHTGRVIRASKLMVVGYALINLAALLRVFIPWLKPAHTMTGILVAGVCWSLAFILYLWEYTPYLTQPRPDGKEG